MDQTYNQACTGNPQVTVENGNLTISNGEAPLGNSPTKKRKKHTHSTHAGNAAASQPKRFIDPMGHMQSQVTCSPRNCFWCGKIVKEMCGICEVPVGTSKRGHAMCSYFYHDYVLNGLAWHDSKEKPPSNDEVKAIRASKMQQSTFNPATVVASRVIASSS